MNQKHDIIGRLSTASSPEIIAHNLRLWQAERKAHRAKLVRLRFERGNAVLPESFILPAKSNQ